MSQKTIALRRVRPILKGETMNKIALVTKVNKRKIFLGKHIGDIIVREFPFRHAILWKDGAIGFDIRLMEYARKNKVKKFIFTDTVKTESFQIGFRSLDNNKWISTESAKEGEQVYIKKDLLKKRDFVNTPYIKNELYI